MVLSGYQNGSIFGPFCESGGILRRVRRPSGIPDGLAQIPPQYFKPFGVPKWLPKCIPKSIIFGIIFRCISRCIFGAILGCILGCIFASKIDPNIHHHLTHFSSAAGSGNTPKNWSKERQAKPSKIMVFLRFCKDFEACGDPLTACEKAIILDRFFNGFWDQF